MECLRACALVRSTKIWRHGTRLRSGPPAVCSAPKSLQHVSPRSWAILDPRFSGNIAKYPAATVRELPIDPLRIPWSAHPRDARVHETGAGSQAVDRLAHVGCAARQVDVDRRRQRQRQHRNARTSRRRSCSSNPAGIRSVIAPSAGSKGSRPVDSLTGQSSWSKTATGTKVEGRSRSRHRHQYIVAGARPRLSVNARTPSPLRSWAAISPRHLSSVVFVMPPIVAATKLAPRWGYRALMAQIRS